MTTRPSSSPLRLASSTIVAMVLLFAGCQSNEPIVSPPPTEIPNSYSNATLPLVIGNQWVYADSVATGEVYLYCETVSGYAQILWAGVWTITQGPVGMGAFPVSNLVVRGDTIFNFSSSDGHGRYQVLYIPRIAARDTAVLPPSAGQFGPTKVYPLTHPCAVPAGTFDSCLVYEEYGPPLKVRLYFRPGVGMIARELFSWEDSTRLVQREVLLYAKIAHP